MLYSKAKPKLALDWIIMVQDAIFVPLQTFFHCIFLFVPKTTMQMPILKFHLSQPIKVNVGKTLKQSSWQLPKHAMLKMPKDNNQSIWNCSISIVLKQNRVVQKQIQIGASAKNQMWAIFVKVSKEKLLLPVAACFVALHRASINKLTCCFATPAWPAWSKTGSVISQSWFWALGTLAAVLSIAGIHMWSTGVWRWMWAPEGFDHDGGVRQKGKLVFANIGSCLFSQNHAKRVFLVCSLVSCLIVPRSYIYMDAETRLVTVV